MEKYEETLQKYQFFIPPPVFGDFSQNMVRV